ncbi:hypothetical protein GRI34_12495 [Erythrobacter aquimaris]|uniref:Uncharacterized protein n=1 Tax=Qipengyuania aquimaris TaxID=255984 RepID=A0A6I4TQK2_9SPHN|nr:hypothetical protein [Qipengyuania aquimaris]MXO97237.1 hypothetical protein [Qipengyuania aquimaris]
MQLGARQAEQVLATRFGISEDRLLRFRGRIDRLRQLDCPQGIKTGKGRPAIFEWQQLLELAVAVSLLDVGIAPEHVAAVVNRHATDIHLAVAEFVENARKDGNFDAAYGAEDWPTERSLALVGSSFAIAGMRSSGDLAEPVIDCVEQSDLAAWLQDLGDPLRSIFFVDLGATLLALIFGLQRMGAANLDQILAAIEKTALTSVESVLEGLDDLNP